MKKVNLSQITNYLRNLLPKTGEILLPYWQSGHLSVRYKGKRNIVTEADLAVDEFLRTNLRDKHPEIPILSEETYSGNLDEYKNKKLLWVIDPLDGTTNFARKIPHFAVSVALISGQEILISTVYSPITKSFYWTNCDEKKAYCDDQVLSVSKVDNLEEAIVYTDWSHKLNTHKDTQAIIKKLDGYVRTVRINGSAVSDLLNLACGRIDAYHHLGLNPWDLAAAALIVQKGGARVTDINGGSWNVFTPGILVANPLLHKKLISLLKTKQLQTICHFI